VTLAGAGTGEGRAALIRLRARAGAPPLGVVFGGALALGAGAVALLGLDRLRFVACVFKALTGLPCPTCGSTRVLGRLAHGDLAGALAMNPLAAAGAVLLAAWAVVDLVLLPSRRAVSLELHPRLARPVRALVVVVFLANWVYLMLAGR
jgi:hypothetical protein